MEELVWNKMWKMKNKARILKNALSKIRREEVVEEELLEEDELMNLLRRVAKRGGPCMVAP